jgi:hypothetical protein
VLSAEHSGSTEQLLIGCRGFGSLHPWPSASPTALFFCAVSHAGSCRAAPAPMVAMRVFTLSSCQGVLIVELWPPLCLRGSATAFLVDKLRKNCPPLSFSFRLPIYLCVFFPFLFLACFCMRLFPFPFPACFHIRFPPLLSPSALRSIFWV